MFFFIVLALGLITFMVSVRVNYLRDSFLVLLNAVLLPVNHSSQ